MLNKKKQTTPALFINNIKQTQKILQIEKITIESNIALL